MLQLKNICKDYPAGDNTVHALKNVDLTFRKSDFVSILGPSGCGKTTMLNIIGGLDKYTSGDLIINGISTKSFKDRDWDAYRNHSVGFVFQSYNLIPHQSVLQNVELALSLSGVSKSERRKRAKDALALVGLGDQLKKKPGEMSGGQMQRVAIARAIVNNPDIVLADEPTGALDTETSLQVMEILKEIAKDRLVIMVTHNPDLAEKYSTRIIKMLDGEITDDSAPLTQEELDLLEVGMDMDETILKTGSIPMQWSIGAINQEGGHSVFFVPKWCLPTTRQMNSSNTNVGGWNVTLLRSWLNNEFLNDYLPDDIASLVKSRDIKISPAFYIFNHQHSREKRLPNGSLKIKCTQYFFLRYSQNIQ